MKDWSDMGSILCIRLDAFGDLLMTEPALRALRQHLPKCKLSLLTSAAGAQAATFMPYLDEVLIYEAPWMKRCPVAADPRRHQDFIERVRSLHFDAAIIFTVYSQNPLPAAMLCYLAGVPRRIAFCRENPYQLLTDWLPEQEPQAIQRHEVERQLALVAEMGATVDDDTMQIVIAETARNLAEFYWRKIWAAEGKYRIVIHPGASAASRRYPATQFAAAMKLIQAVIPAVFIVTGDVSELALANEIAVMAGSASHVVAGQLDVPEWAAVVDSADLLISNNTGAVHIAAATSTLVVDVYALTNPQHTPWRVRSKVLSHDVPCKNCYKSICPEGHHQCLLGVSPQQLASAAIELLEAELQCRPGLGAPILNNVAG